LLLLGALLLLLAAFFRLQVIGSSEFLLRSQENRLRAITVPAPRGTIYDRHGRVVAENVPGYSISLLPGSPDTLRATLDRLAPYLDLGEERIQSLDARTSLAPWWRCGLGATTRPVAPSPTSPATSARSARRSWSARFTPSTSRAGSSARTGSSASTRDP
jgi:cell division protein FtsI/penicillin-binding protein 2